MEIIGPRINVVSGLFFCLLITSFALTHLSQSAHDTHSICVMELIAPSAKFLVWEIPDVQTPICAVKVGLDSRYTIENHLAAWKQIHVLVAIDNPVEKTHWIHK